MIPAPLQALDAADAVAREHVARLHHRLLPQSQFSRLGVGFMRDFYYREPVRLKLIHVLTYRREGVPIGFITYTFRPRTFVDDIRQRTGWTAVRYVLRSLAANPFRIQWLLKSDKYLLRRRQMKEDAGLCEVLSFGVLPEHSMAGERSPLRPSQTLFQAVIELSKKEGCKSIQMGILKTNRASLMFFQSYGAKPSPCDYFDAESRLLKLWIA